MPTSKMAHAEGGERKHTCNNNKAKLDQLKLSKIDPSKWS
jgi:hypothetical protein